MLTGKQRAYLRSRANDLQPIIQIGKNGINDALIELIIDALDTHELIKINVLETAFLSAREACDIVVEKTKCEPVQCIGYKFVIYKRSSKVKNQKIDLAAVSGKKVKKDPSVKPGEKAKAAREAKKEQKNKFFKQLRESSRKGGSGTSFKKSSSSHSRKNPKSSGR